MKRDNAYTRFRKSLKIAADDARATPDRVVDDLLFETRANAMKPAKIRTVRAASRKSPASRKVPAPA
jgi:hypothetical protein